MGDSREQKSIELPRTSVGGVRIVTLSRPELINRMMWAAPAIRKSGQRVELVFDMNGHGLSLYAKDRRYRQCIDDANIVHADGAVLVAASRYFSVSSIRDRSATTDIYLDSLKIVTRERVRYYLLGATDKVVHDCAVATQRLAENIDVVGYHNGYFDESDEKRIIDNINKSRVDVLWVGLGKPREQDFCVRNRAKLKVGWAVTCGGLFNYISGDYTRAPKWMQDVGLEWLHRMIMNPRHLFWRYLTTNPHALWLIWKNRRES